MTSGYKTNKTLVFLWVQNLNNMKIFFYHPELALVIRESIEVTHTDATAATEKTRW